MNLLARLKNIPRLKALLLWALMPSGQARPRLWVRLFVHPFCIKRGRGVVIRFRTRLDVFPFKRFAVGSRSTIEDFCTINNAVGDVVIGHQTRIGIGSVLIGPVVIGNDVRLAQHVVISGLNHNYEDVTMPISEQGVRTALVDIGDETWIGSNSVIVAGVSIGKHCVVAAGSVVTRSVPSYCVVAGNPAKIIKRYNQTTKEWERG